MTNCLFCKIIDRSISAEIVYEDKDVIAFLDINPVNHGHVLVVPKIHAAALWDLDDDACCATMPAIKRVMTVLTQNLGYEGTNLIQNNGKAAGQVVPHVHFHVIPRKANDGFTHWQGQAYGDGEAALWAAKIREGLLS